MKKYLLFLIFTSTLESAVSQTNVLNGSGNVGISTLSPSAKLSFNDFNDVNDGSDGPDGITWFNPNLLTYGIYRTVGSWIGPDYQQHRLQWGTGIILDPGVADRKSYVKILRVMSGNLGIGVISPTEKLSVNGKIRAKEIKVEASVWPDLIFKKSYQLPSLKSTAEYINANGHLECIPTSAQVESDGIDLGYLNAKLLHKIEELTLHLIA